MAVPVATKTAIKTATTKSVQRPAASVASRRDGGRREANHDARDESPRLLVGRPGEALEREADRASARALHDRATGAARARARHVSREMSEAAASDSPIWRQRSRMLARERERASRLAAPAPDAIPTQAEVGRARGGGTPLPATVRAEMEGRLGHGLGDVRIHRGRRAAGLAASLGARAFTVGQDVFLGGGAPGPESAASRPMLAHELAHVGQQRAGRAGPAAAVVQRQVAGAEAETGGAAAPMPAPMPEPPAAAARAAGKPAAGTEVAETPEAEAAAGPVPAFAVGLLKMGAFKVQRKGKQGWQAAISARLARQLPTSQVIVLATAAVGHEVLRAGDKDGTPTAPLPIDSLLAVAEDRSVVETRVQKDRPDQRADVALVTVHREAIDRMRERLGPEVTQVGLEKETRTIEPREDFPESFPQGFVAGTTAEAAAESLPARHFGLKDFVLMHAGAQIGELEGVVKGIENVAKQVVSLFKPEFWKSLGAFLFDSLPAILADEQLQFDIGFTHGVAFAHKLKGLAKLPPFELGRAIGEMVGELAVEVAIAVLTAGAVAAIKKALEGARILEGLAGVRGLVGKLGERIGPKIAELKERFPGGFRAATEGGTPRPPLSMTKGAAKEATKGATAAERVASAEGAPAAAAAPKVEPAAKAEAAPAAKPEIKGAQAENERPAQVKVEPPPQLKAGAAPVTEAEAKAAAATKEQATAKTEAKPEAKAEAKTKAKAKAKEKIKAKEKAAAGPDKAKAAIEALPKPERPAKPSAPPRSGKPAATPKPEPQTAAKAEAPKPEAAASVPVGLTEAQFAEAVRTLRSGVADIGDEIFVHGSRVSGTALATSDIDFGIRLTPDRFDVFLRQRFGTPQLGSAKFRTMQHALETGKIQAGEAGLRGLRRALEAHLGMEVDISVIRAGGPFDKGPFIVVP